MVSAQGSVRVVVVVVRAGVTLDNNQCQCIYMYQTPFDYPLMALQIQLPPPLAGQLPLMVNHRWHHQAPVDARQRRPEASLIDRHRSGHRLFDA